MNRERPGDERMQDQLHQRQPAYLRKPACDRLADHEEAEGEQAGDGAAVVDTYTGKVPGAAVADLFVIGDRSGTFDVTYGVTEDGDELRTVVLKGPFYAGSTSTYTARLTSLPQAVAISRP